MNNSNALADRIPETAATRGTRHLSNSIVVERRGVIDRSRGKAQGRTRFLGGEIGATTETAKQREYLSGRNSRLVTHAPATVP